MKDGLTVNQRKFIAVFRMCGNVSKAARETKTCRTNHFAWMKDSHHYREAFKDAKEHSVDVLEEEAWRRAVDGTNKPIYYLGELVGTVKEYSDSLMALLLKGNRPRKFRDREIGIHGKMDHRHAHIHQVNQQDPAKFLSQETLEMILRDYEKSELKELPAPKEETNGQNGQQISQG